MKPHYDKINALMRNPAFAAKQHLLKDVLAHYLAWCTASEALKSRDTHDIRKLTELLNTYKDFLDQPCYKDRSTGFSPQTCLHSSVLEEFCTVLLAPLQLRTGLNVGGKDTYVEMQFRPRDVRSFSSRPPIVVTTKDQDFAFGKEVLVTCSYDDTSSEAVRTCVPVVCLECKTNFDKTMYTAASDTAYNCIGLQ